MKNINLIEGNQLNIYNWNKLINNSIPISKYISITRNNLNDKLEVIEKENKKELKEDKRTQTTIHGNNEIGNYKYNLNKRNRNRNNSKYKHKKSKTVNINKEYNKRINVICKLPNESLNNYNENINEKRRVAPEIGPRLKLKNKNLQNEIKVQRVLAFNKEIKLNVLLSNELDKENLNFNNEDLIIASKRKNADILIKSFSYNLNKNKKKYLKTFKSYENFEYLKKNKILFRKENTKKKKGLILSFYDEKSPDIKIFDNITHKMIEIDKNRNTDKEDDEVIKPTLKKNFFSKLNLFNLSNLDINNNKEKNSKYELIEGKSYINDNNRKQIQISNNFFINREAQIYEEELKKKKIYKLRRPMSSSNIKSNTHKKFGFTKINLNENEKNLPGELKTIYFLSSFPTKITSKVGNIIYDKINKMLKYKSKNKLKLKKNKNNHRKNNKLESKENDINKYNYSDMESKENKIIPKYYFRNIKEKTKNKAFTSIKNKSTYYNIFEDDLVNLKNKINIYDFKLKLKNLKKKIFSPLTIHNQKGNNLYSSSLNYIINNKRKKKNKMLSDYSDNPSLNEILSEIFFEEKFTQISELEEIKANNYKN